jgi:hypothetical protein
MTTTEVPVNFCRSCGVRIQWYRSNRGKPTPVNENPSPNGNVRIDSDLLGGPVAVVVSDGTGDRLAHFVTCPDADKWRKPHG